MKRVVFGVLVVVALLAWSSSAHADASSCEARVELAHRTLDDRARRTERWHFAWESAMAAITVGQMGAIPLVGDEDRVDLYVGGASALVGLLTLAWMPPTAIEDAPRFEARLGDPDRCALAREGERLLDRAAKSEAATTGLWAHVGNIAFNLGLGAILGFGFGHWTSAFLNVGLGTAVGEALIVTYPTTAGRPLFTF